MKQEETNRDDKFIRRKHKETISIKIHGKYYNFKQLQQENFEEYFKQEHFHLIEYKEFFLIDKVISIIFEGLTWNILQRLAKVLYKIFKEKIKVTRIKAQHRGKVLIFNNTDSEEEILEKLKKFYD